MTHLHLPPYARFPAERASILLSALSLFALVSALSQCLCSESPYLSINVTVFMFVTRLSRSIHIYIFIYIAFDIVHVTAVGLCTYYPWIRVHTRTTKLGVLVLVLLCTCIPRGWHLDAETFSSFLRNMCELTSYCVHLVVDITDFKNNARNM
jgi:hypothetical protein